MFLNLMLSSIIFVQNHWFNLFLLYFKQNLDSYLLNITTCTPLAPRSKNMWASFRLFCQHNLLSFVDQYFVKCLQSFFSQNSKWACSNESLSLNMCKDQELSTTPVLASVDRYIVIVMNIEVEVEVWSDLDSTLLSS